MRHSTLYLLIAAALAPIAYVAVEMNHSSPTQESHALVSKDTNPASHSTGSKSPKHTIQEIDRDTRSDPPKIPQTTTARPYNLATAELEQELEDTQDSGIKEEEPEILEDDIALDDIPEDDPYFPPTVVGKMLSQHMYLTEGLGPDAEEKYQESLEQLRQEGEAVVDLLSDAYTKAPEGAYLDRWRIVDTLASLDSERSLKKLAEIAQSEVPEEISTDLHGFSSKSEELMIRHAAINGIKKLAQSGDQLAEETLLNLTTAPEENVREGAILAYLATGGDREQKQQYLKMQLPEEDHWMIELEEVDNTSEVENIYEKLVQESSSESEPDFHETRKIDSLPPLGVDPESFDSAPEHLQ